jgi:hypothetical protein
MVRQRVGEERGYAGVYMYDVNAFDDNGINPQPYHLSNLGDL